MNHSNVDCPHTRDSDEKTVNSMAKEQHGVQKRRIDPVHWNKVSRTSTIVQVLTHRGKPHVDSETDRQPGDVAQHFPKAGTVIVRRIMIIMPLTFVAHPKGRGVNNTLQLWWWFLFISLLHNKRHAFSESINDYDPLAQQLICRSIIATEFLSNRLVSSQQSMLPNQ